MVARDRMVIQEYMGAARQTFRLFRDKRSWMHLAQILLLEILLDNAQWRC